MRRRGRPVEHTVPPELWTFDGAFWDGDVEEWVGARRAYADAHGWPGGIIDLICQEREVRQAHGIPVPPRRVPRALRS